MTEVCPVEQRERGTTAATVARPVWRSDGSCSYCNSIHPDAFMAAIVAGYVVAVTHNRARVFLDAPDYPAKPANGYKPITTSSARPFILEHLSVEQLATLADLFLSGKINVRGKLDPPEYLIAYHARLQRLCDDIRRNTA